MLYYWLCSGMQLPAYIDVDKPCGRPVRVLYSTALDKAKKSSMTKIIKRLGGSVEDAEGPEFTHFVALQPTAANQTDRGFKKSINALIALAAGQYAFMPCICPFSSGGWQRPHDCISSTQPMLRLDKLAFFVDAAALLASVTRLVR